MPAERKAARLMEWRGKWYLFYTDYATGKTKRIQCAALKAFTREERRELVSEYRSREVNQQAESNRRGTGLKYDAKLVEELDGYLAVASKRSEVRLANPEAREGISPRTFEVIQNIIKHFKSWLAAEGLSKIQTGALDVPTLTRYFDALAAEPARLGNSKVKRSAATLNQYRRTLKTALAYINLKRPRRFPDFEELKAGVKSLRGKAPMPVAFAPADLTAFLDKALEREEEDRSVVVVRRKGEDGKEEQFTQAVVKQAATPVSRLFLLLCMTGCRRGEALNLKWADVDLERGRIIIRAEKTGRTRWLILSGAAEGEVAPKFLELLKAWREENEEREYVLPHDGLKQPTFPKGAWDGVNVDLKHKIAPQKLRQNFTSYAASLGVPAPVAAMWQGHGVEVAERHYRAQVLDRMPGKSFEEAMGLKTRVDALLKV